MSGVSLLDSLLDRYKIKIRTANAIGMRILYYFLDVIIVNFCNYIQVEFNLKNIIQKAILATY